MKAPIEPWDLTKPQTKAVKALAAGVAFRVHGAYRCKAMAARIGLTVAGRLLDLGVAEKRVAANGTPYLRLTEDGRAVAAKLRAATPETSRTRAAIDRHERIAP